MILLRGAALGFCVLQLSTYRTQLCVINPRGFKMAKVVLGRSAQTFLSDTISFSLCCPVGVT
jgi:hypothetical protein